MSWGTELWDQFENLSLHTQKGIEFLERYGHFIRDRCAIEFEYAAKLRRLVKSYQPKKKEEEDYQYSPCRAFKMELNEVNDQAGQREVIAENLQGNVLRELNILVKDFKEDRKKHLQEGARLMATLAGQIGNLERARKAYEKAFREAERAVENYQRADADLNLSRAEVEKQRMNMTMKTQQSEEAKTEYANQLQKTNDMQTLHYHTAMPEVFQHLQELDEKRIKNMRNYMMKSVEIERAVAPIIAQCLDGIEKAANEINEKEDTMLVIERYKSGFQPPGDFPFEDLSVAKNYDSNSQLAQPVMQPIHNHLTVKGTVSGGKIKKRVGLFGIFSSNKFLKRRWALWCISKQNKTDRSKLKNDEIMFNIKRMWKPCTDNPKIIMDENSCDSISFYGADQKGNSLFIKMNHRGYHIVELILQLILLDGRVYVLPDYPDKTMTKNTNKKWSASGLKIESLEPRQRWRITYNGLLWNQCRGDTSNEDNVEYIRLNFIFIGKSRSLEWPGDWSTYLHADALAREPWKSPNWMHKIKLIDYTGFDLWGSIIGQITYKDKNINALYLRGLCQRRWGKHESYQFHRIITFFGVTRHGAMYYLSVSDTKYSFSHMQFGHLEEAGGTISKIDWTDLKLSDFEKGDSVPMNYKIAFTAAGKNYDVIINYAMADAITYYNDKSYWTCTTRNLHVQLNGSRGVGLMTMCCPYTGSKQIMIPVTRVQYLTRSDKFAQKDRYILHFADKQCQNEQIVGGKAYSLAVLTSIDTSDFIVPQGFCVTSLALERQLQYHKQLQDLINNIIDISRGKKKEDLKAYCQKAVSIIQTTPVEEQIKQAILEGLERLEMFVNEKDVCNLYAVRSSAVGEDSEETSAAGQNSTYLGVKNANDVIKCVAKCWASLFSYQSVEYRRQNGLPIKVSMGVCIQRLIDAETAGVMFTRHPTTGDPSSIIITANYGLGETVVSGTVEPDTLTIHRKLNNTLTIGALMIGSKEQKISLKNDVVTRCTLNKQETRKISISDATALRLAKIGLYLESLFGSARDVEWAVVGEQIFLLQARPITTINAWTDFELMHELDSEVPSDVDLITFANVEEVLPHPVSPLSSSTIVKILNLSVGYKYNLDCTYLHMVSMRCAINYFNCALRDVDKKITIFNKMSDLAICGRVVTTPEIYQLAVEKYGIANRWRKMYLMYDLFKTAWMGDAIIKAASDAFNKCILNTNEFDTPHNLYSTINKKYKELFRIAQCHNAASMMNVSYEMIAMSFLTKGSDNFTSDHLADIAVLLSSCTNVISTEVPIALSKIAACIRKNGKAKEFSKVESAKAIDWLKSNCPPAAEKLRTFFDTHGHRCVHEMDLFAEPWIFKSDSIISTIQIQAMSLEKNYVSKTLNVQETIASLKTPMSSFTKWFLQQVIPLCRKAVTRREMTKNILVSAVHTLRLAYKHLSVLMVAENCIPDENLIFFLTHQEIGQLLNKHNSLLVRKALRRKKIYQQVAKFKYPEFSIGMPIPVQRTLDTSSYKGCTKVEGTSIYDGSVLGRACVITDLSEAKNIQHGDILITHCTDIGWSPYFPLLGGIATELGGLISHGAVVAREYGLPCIVGAKSATQVFQTGDTVLLAADVGVLQLIEKA